MLPPIYIYWLLNLEGEVHSIWNLLINDLQEYKDNDFFEVGRADINLILSGVQKPWSFRTAAAPARIYLPGKVHFEGEFNVLRTTLIWHNSFLTTQNGAPQILHSNTTEMHQRYVKTISWMRIIQFVGCNGAIWVFGDREGLIEEEGALRYSNVNGLWGCRLRCEAIGRKSMCLFAAGMHPCMFLQIM